MIKPILPSLNLLNTNADGIRHLLSTPAGLILPANSEWSWNCTSITDIKRVNKRIQFGYLGLAERYQGINVENLFLASSQCRQVAGHTPPYRPYSNFLFINKPCGFKG